MGVYLVCFMSFYWILVCIIHVCVPRFNQLKASNHALQTVSVANVHTGETIIIFVFFSQNLHTFSFKKGGAISSHLSLQIKKQLFNDRGRIYVHVCETLKVF